MNERAESVLKLITASSVLLYICGFIALRARLNLFGFHEEALPFNDTRYFGLGAAYVLHTAFALFPLAFFSILAAAIFYLFGSRLSTLRLGLERWLNSHPRMRLCFAVGLAFVFTRITQAWIYRVWSAKSWLLEEREGPPGPHTPFLSIFGLDELDLKWLTAREYPDMWLLLEYDRLLGLLISTALLIWALRSSTIGHPAQWLSTYLCVLLGFQLLSLPTGYAIVGYGYHYPFATIQLKDTKEPSKPHFVVLEDDKEVLLFNREDRFVLLPRDAVASRTIHCSNANILLDDSCPHRVDGSSKEPPPTSLRGGAGP